MEVLFNKTEVKQSLMLFKQKMEAAIFSSEFDKSRNNYIVEIVKFIYDDAKHWDEHCSISIKSIGDKFISLISQPEELIKEELDDIFVMCFRFIYEYFLSTSKELSIYFYKIKDFSLNNLSLFNSRAKRELEFSIYSLPISIFKEVSKSECLLSIKKFESVINNANNLENRWNKEISDKEEKVNLLKESLDKYESGYNFVGLYEGFNELSESKIAEKNNILFWLKFLSVIVFVPIIIELYFIYNHIDDISVIKNGIIVSIFPTLSIIVISMYYFRVLLFNYKSVKAQILQIELRKTLCRFIESYTNFSHDIKSKDSISLDKFENIIFSSIVSDEGNLPTTFDGIDQLSQVIKSIKS